MAKKTTKAAPRKVLKPREKVTPIESVLLQGSGEIVDGDVVSGTTNVLPIFEGVQVTAILNDGKETPTHYHCRMANGTTMHVPKFLFN